MRRLLSQVKGKGARTQRGIALLLVLWILIVLMGIVLSLSALTRSETHAALAFRTGLENKFLAEAAVEKGVVEVLYRAVKRQSAVLEEGQVWRTDGTPYYGRIGEGGYRVAITDESGKIAINALTDISGIVLKNLLTQSGVAPQEADIIVDSILDWRDEDDLHRLNGAENEYYATLPNAYKPRNAPFETLEELLLVRGMNAAILYGTKEKPGIMPLLSVDARTDMINLAAAPRRVLMALPGMTEDAADRILEYRKVTEIRGPEEVRDLVGAGYTAMAPYVATAESGIYSITAVGWREKEQNGYVITATIALEGGQQPYRTLYYKSPAGVRP